MQFGEDAIEYDPQNQQTVGDDIRDTADVLHSNPATKDDAAKLIDLALHMNPPLRSHPATVHRSSNPPRISNR